MGKARTPIEELYVVDERGCWVWTGALNKGGYPMMPWETKQRRAQRFLFERDVRALRPREVVTATCRRRLCVNPEHVAVRRAGEPQRDAVASLTWEDVRAIRELSAQGMKAAAIARRFSVTATNVSIILRNVTWHDPDYTPGFRRVCAYGGCGVEFVTQRSNKRFCSKRHQSAHKTRVDRGFYERQAMAAAAPRARRAAHDGLWLARSLDAPLGEGGALADVVGTEADVFDEVEQRRLAKLLDGLSLEDVAAMGEHELVALRARLASEGFRPSAVAA